MYLFSVIILGLIFLFFLIKKPYYIAAFLFFLFFYGFNVPTPLFLDLRGFLTTFLLIRLLLEKENHTFFIDKYFYLLSFFILYSLVITVLNFTGSFGYLKESIIMFGVLILGFVVGINPKGKNVFILAIIAAGFFTTIDLIYSYTVMDSFKSARVLDIIFFKNYTLINHNRFGLVCGISLILTYLYFIKKKLTKLVALPLIVIYSLGLILSTSRGALLGVIVTFIFIAIIQKEVKFNLKKIVSFVVSALFFFVSFYFIYNIILSSAMKDPQASKNNLADKILYRLYMEPAKLLGIDVSENVVAEKVEHGNFEWRYGKSNRDILNYIDSDVSDILFGIGMGGYVQTNYSDDDLNAHNAYVLLLIECGIFGFFLFTGSFSLIIYKSLKLSNKLDVPMGYLFMYLSIYAVGHNGELTGSLAFLILGGIIGNTRSFEFKYNSFSRFKKILYELYKEEENITGSKNTAQIPSSL